MEVEDCWLVVYYCIIISLLLLSFIAVYYPAQCVLMTLYYAFINVSSFNHVQRIELHCMIKAAIPHLATRDIVLPLLSHMNDGNNNDKSAGWPP